MAALETLTDERRRDAATVAELEHPPVGPDLHLLDD
jgi:hypothetical protein